MAEQQTVRVVSRRGFITSSLILVGALAACGQASPASSSAAPASSSAAPKPSVSTAPASAAASAKPAGSAAASAKPAGSAAASPASAKPSTAAGAVTLAWVNVSANQLVGPLAQDAGYFDKYGVKVDLQYLNGSGASTPALLANTVQMVQTGGQVVVAAQAVKQDLVMISSYQNTAAWLVMANPEVKTVQDLKGKPVSVGRIGQNDYFGWVWLANKQGWKPEDFQYVSSNGDQPAQLAMLKSGNAVATIVQPPNEVIAARQGAHLIIDSTPDKFQVQLVGLVVTRQWLTQNRPLAVNLLKAIVEASHRWTTDRPFTETVIKKWLKDDDADVVASSYKLMADALPKVPYPSREGMIEQVKEVGTLAPDAKNVNPDTCIDLSLVKELDDSGFIKQIYGS
jgi:NitT/TauT family transport system substrate-binding protein